MGVGRSGREQGSEAVEAAAVLAEVDGVAEVRVFQRARDGAASGRMRRGKREFGSGDFVREKDFQAQAGVAAFEDAHAAVAHQGAGEFAFGAAQGATTVEMGVAQEMVVEQALAGLRAQRREESVFHRAPEMGDVESFHGTKGDGRKRVGSACLCP